jgi:iron only hydrogenase large subunit-like protein
MDAIGSDEHGRAKIDYDKCVSCGMCLVNCPFGAIVDKGQIFQLINAILQGDKVVAIVAPAFLGQFGPDATPERLTAAMKRLGFAGVVEVAVGADLCTIEEAKDFMEKVPAEQPFMATSCCPSWSVMAKKLFPQFADYISMALTPMVLTARLQKQKDPGCRIAFIGPCAAKKLEASRRTIRSDVDFVLTFEELQGMFEAKGVGFASIPPEEEVPLVEIPEEETPLAEIPEEPEEIEVPEEEVPLSDVPQTGDGSAKWYAMTLLSAAALAVISLFQGKKDQEG